MGYDLEFHFNEPESYDKDLLISRLKAAGAIAYIDEGVEDGMQLVFAGVSFFFNDSQKALSNGHWLWCRAPRNKESLIDLAMFASGLGCKLHDPQLSMDLDLRDLHQVNENNALLDEG